jgi:methylmalonyl-CoA/ethylmalonyl-CoA epimerase
VEEHPGAPGAPLVKNGVAQIGFVVRNLDEVVQQYWKLLGIGPWHFYTYGPPLVKTMSYHGRPVQYSMRIALANIGPLRIELIEPVGGETVYAEFVREHGYGVHHLGLLVEDMTSALSVASAAGLPMTMDGAGFGKDGDGHYAYLDTEALIGTTLELIERPKGRVTPEKVYPPPSNEPA